MTPLDAHTPDAQNLSVQHLPVRRSEAAERSRLSETSEYRNALGLSDGGDLPKTLGKAEGMAALNRRWTSFTGYTDSQHPATPPKTKHDRAEDKRRCRLARQPRVSWR